MTQTFRKQIVQRITRNFLDIYAQQLDLKVVSSEKPRATFDKFVKLSDIVCVYMFTMELHACSRGIHYSSDYPQKLSVAKDTLLRARIKSL